MRADSSQEIIRSVEVPAYSQVKEATQLIWTLVVGFHFLSDLYFAFITISFCDRLVILGKRLWEIMSLNFTPVQT